MDTVPSKIDLLIRSASTLLSIIGQQVEERPLIQEASSRNLRSLDRIALLLVTKDKEEAAAVLAVNGPNGCTLVHLIDSPDDVESPLRYTHSSLNLKIPLIQTCLARFIPRWKYRIQDFPLT